MRDCRGEMVVHEDGTPVCCVHDLHGRGCRSRSDIRRHQAIALCTDVSPTGRCSRCEAVRRAKATVTPTALKRSRTSELARSGMVAFERGSA